MLAQSSDLPVAPVKDAQFHGKLYLLWYMFRQRDQKNSKNVMNGMIDNNGNHNNMHISVL